MNKSAIGVGCLCRKDPGPNYLRGRATKWSQGFLYGYVQPDGFFFDYPVTILNGRTVVHGKVYEG